MPGLLDNQTPEQAEIARLEAAIAQMQQQNQGIASQLGAPGIADDTRMGLENSQQQRQMGIGSMQGLLSELGGGQQQAAPQAAPQGGAQQSPEGQEIASLENQIQMLQAQDPSGSGGIYGMLGYNQMGMGGGQQDFKPTMPVGHMQDIYAALAGGADDPAAIGQSYVKAMQNNDTLKADQQESRYRVTDAMRPKPFGSGFTDSQGNFVATTWDPNLDKGRGGFRTTTLGKRMPNTFTVGGVEYMRNLNQPDIGAADAFVPTIDPQAAGINQGVMETEAGLAEAQLMTRKEAAELAAEMSLMDGFIKDLINAPNFSESVGPLDTLVAKVGGSWLGGKDSLLNRQMEMVHNQLTIVKVSDWKGAISNAELTFFKSTVPKPTDHHEVWQTWYRDVYVPTTQFALMRAADEINFLNSNLRDFVLGTGNEMDAIMNNPLVQKYLETG